MRNKEISQKEWNKRFKKNLLTTCATSFALLTFGVQMVAGDDGSIFDYAFKGWNTVYLIITFFTAYCLAKSATRKELGLPDEDELELEEKNVKKHVVL